MDTPTIQFYNISLYDYDQDEYLYTKVYFPRVSGNVVQIDDQEGQSYIWPLTSINHMEVEKYGND